MKFSSRIETCFADCKASGRPAFVAYIAAGDPDYSGSLKVVDTLVENGVDLIELGLPFADPLADGPTNQAAAERALASGMDYLKTFEFASEVRRKYTDLPLVLYTYLNPIAHTADFTKNCQLAKSSGIDAMLILDLPPNEGKVYAEVLNANAVGRVALAAPTTAESRLPAIAETATEFVYYVSQVGVTGARTDVASDVNEHISTIKKYTDLPVVVGFGISSPEHVTKLKTGTGVDGIVVGSAIVKRIAKIAEGSGTYKELGEFVSSLTKACRS